MQIAALFAFARVSRGRRQFLSERCIALGAQRLLLHEFVSGSSRLVTRFATLCDLDVFFQIISARLLSPLSRIVLHAQ